MKALLAHNGMPLGMGTLYFSGIGGIGMSAVAEILHNLGYDVAGSDMAENANVLRLKKLGIPVFPTQEEKYIKNIAALVRSTAIGEGHPEVVAARAQKIPVVHRSEMLAEIMRLKTSVAIAGTHGKTTTTSMMAALFDEEGLDPTVINGGIINAYGTNAYLGKGEWLVAEADESDGSFLRLPAKIGVITNIDAEHMEYYGSFEALFTAYKNFLYRLPFYGFCVLCKDHPHIRRLIDQVIDRQVITYSVEGQADIAARNIRFSENTSIYDVVLDKKLGYGEQLLPNVVLPMPGLHNIQNSLAAIAVAVKLGFSARAIRDGFKKFQGVKRRFTKVAEIDGITIIDDYGHHPREIEMTLKTARQVVDGYGKGSVIAVVQPHRYSRVRDLFDAFCHCFNDADTVVVTDIYSAGEEPIAPYDKEYLAEAVRKTGHQKVFCLEEPQALAGLVKRLAQAGDMVVCLGAGSISQWAYALPEALEKLNDAE